MDDPLTQSERSTFDHAISLLSASSPTGMKGPQVHAGNVLDIRPRLTIVRVSQWRHALAAINPAAIGEEYCPDGQQLLTRALPLTDARRLFKAIGDMAKIISDSRSRNATANDLLSPSPLPHREGRAS
jgi:hypothetical protein